MPAAAATAMVSSRRTGGPAARVADTLELTGPINDVPMLGQIDLNQSVQLALLTAILFRPFVFTIGDRPAPLRRVCPRHLYEGGGPFDRLDQRSGRKRLGQVGETTRRHRGHPRGV